MHRDSLRNNEGSRKYQVR
uniref:Uncharacterized protein n=1 Tax=Anguilla anguilla TaxID=7936 RepID=A0A0E9THV4_ANGAN